jgi:hypothetical protein
MRDFELLVITEHTFSVMFLRQDRPVPVQLSGTLAKGNMDLFHWELSDHVHWKPDIVLLSLLPPIQQLFMDSPHRLWAKCSSWSDANDAKCPPYLLQHVSESFQDWGLPTWRKHLVLLGSITQPFGHGAAQEEAKMYYNTWILKYEYSNPILMVDKYDNHNVILKHLQIKCIIV